MKCRSAGGEGWLFFRVSVEMAEWNEGEGMRLRPQPYGKHTLVLSLSNLVDSARTEPGPPDQGWTFSETLGGECRPAGVQKAILGLKTVLPGRKIRAQERTAMNVSTGSNPTICTSISTKGTVPCLMPF